MDELFTTLRRITMLQRYVPYLRSTKGKIERFADSIYDSSDDSRGPYVHEDALVGWPERYVFWAKATGPSVGIALFLPLP
jgi:hypothetical protein